MKEPIIIFNLYTIEIKKTKEFLFLTDPDYSYKFNIIGMFDFSRYSSGWEWYALIDNISNINRYYIKEKCNSSNLYVSKEELFDYLKKDYPDYFEWFLFNPEFIK